MLDVLIRLQDAYTPVVLIVAFALAGIIALAVVRNLPWACVILAVWVALWVLAMPKGMDAANLVWDQGTNRDRVHCAGELTKKLGYWTGHRDLRTADCE